MEEKPELTQEQLEDIELTQILNTVVDIMDGHEIGTTQECKQRYGEIVEELVKESKLAYGKIEKDKAIMLSAIAIYGYSTFGVEFLNRLLKKEEFAKATLVSLIESVNPEEEGK